MATNAHISIDQIVRSWLGKRGYTIHYYVKALLLATEAVQELALTSLPMLHHALLTKAENENWFTLPEGYMDFVRVGVRYGDTWFPLTLDERLMPYANSNGLADLVAADFAYDMNTVGGNSSWFSGQNTPASFGSTSFSDEDFDTAGTTSSANPTGLVSTSIDGWYAGWTSYDPRTSVALDIANGQIVAPEGFPYGEIYLVYTGIGTVDNMTGIPVIAQAAIEAYIDYKYAANKRDVSRSETGDWERKWDNQHRILRARVQRWNIQDVAEAFERRFRRQMPADFTTSGTASTTPGSSSNATVQSYYHGSQSGPTPPTQSQLLALTSGDSNIVSFANNTPKYLLFAYPGTQSDPTSYFISSLDNGALGGGGTFAAPITVGSYRLIMSNYPTVAASPVSFL